MSELRVLVVGASVAGPMAAYWLARAGATVTVIERFPSLRTGGQNIDIRTAGVTVMRKIPGMEEAVRAALAPLEGVSFVREDGSPLGVLKGTGDADQQSLVSEFEIYRGDLSRILCDLTKDHPRVTYIFDEQIAAIQQDTSNNTGHTNTNTNTSRLPPCTVQFANGTPAAEYDLVVACDGATSRTRALGLDCGVRDHIHPLGAWAAYYSLPQDILGGSQIGLGSSSPGGRFVSAALDRAGATRIMCMSVHPTLDDPGLAQFRTAQKQGLEQLKQHTLRRFGGSGWRSPELLAGIPPSADFYASELCQVKVPALHRGRFVLVGDAGYAPGTNGFGTTLAMAGAYVLAGELNACNGDLPAGLAAYEERMKPLIADMQVIPPGVLTIMAPQSAAGIWLRNRLFVLVCWVSRFGSALGWLGSFWSSAFGKDKYALPEYDWVD